MTDLVYYILSAVCVALVLLGINLMSKVKLSVTGNALSAFAMIAAMAVTVFRYGIFSPVTLFIALAIGAAIGIYGAVKVKMIDMPQAIALLNGLGGAASALVAAVTAIDGAGTSFEAATAGLALAVGAVTLTGSLIAAAKLARLMDARPKKLPGHNGILAVLLIASIAGIVLQTVCGGGWALLTAISTLVLGVVFVIRVGGADMPITISLLNSLSGVAGGIAGMAINDPMLVVIGGIVGASGLLLTQDMCKAMNRKLGTILSGNTTAAPVKEAPAEEAAPVEEAPAEETKLTMDDVAAKLRSAKKVIIVPGYGMALSQAQEDVGALAAALEKKGAEVKFAIHPVAGRMPGHMSVLLCEADIDYDKLFMMEDINDDFASCDLAIVIGANDVTNPAANTAEGTPIYGMPVLSVENAPATVFCNFDTKPGYAGVPNPLYEADNVLMMLGDAKASVRQLVAFTEKTAEAAPQQESAEEPETGKLTLGAVGAALQSAKKIIIVPGYGMALSQAQANVARLTTALEERGIEVKFAIHPVAGRMPGHMSVLLCEADIDYDKLFMMEDINDDFVSCDLAIVIGANDVTNPAANTAEGTPIYGMPILNVEHAPMAVFCNFDTKPGYAGVPNPLYEADNVLLMLGDAKESVDQLLAFAEGTAAAPAPAATQAEESAKLTLEAVGSVLQEAKKVIVVPGYGMALSQAQANVARLTTALENRGTEVKFAIHPVAGRMPGHMSVLLCEADIDYDKLFMMEDINDDFASCDLAIVIGANDVTNPAANTAEGTPIYGMPILNVEHAPMAVFCNFDTKPGYAGVPNPLYEANNVLLMLGDAKDSVTQLHSFVK